MSAARTVPSRLYLVEGSQRSAPWGRVPLGGFRIKFACRGLARAYLSLRSHARAKDPTAPSSVSPPPGHAHIQKRICIRGVVCPVYYERPARTWSEGCFATVGWVPCELAPSPCAGTWAPKLAQDHGPQYLEASRCAVLLVLLVDLVELVVVVALLR